MNRGAANYGDHNRRFYRRYFGAWVAAIVSGSIAFLAAVTDDQYTSFGAKLAYGIFGFLLFAGPTFLLGWLITRRTRRPVKSVKVHQLTEPGRLQNTSSSSVSTLSEGNGIFVSYRRQDEPNFAGRLSDRLVARFGKENIFMDVDSIGIGVDFVKAMDHSLSQSRALIVIIGKRWVDAVDAMGQRRLSDPGDYVRMEIETALRRKIPLIPVLVEGASMPNRSELPESLVSLTRHNAIEMSHARFNVDADRLVNTLSTILSFDA